MLCKSVPIPPRNCVVCRFVAPDRIELTSYGHDGRPTEGFWSDSDHVRPSGAEQLLERVRDRDGP